MLARIPPTLRWPLSPLKPFASAALTKALSLSSLPVTKVTFISEPLSGRAVDLNSELCLQVIVQLCRLGLVARVHRRQSAMGLDPAENQHHQIDAECRRSVVHGFIFGMSPVLQHRREIFVARFDKIFADDDQRDSAGAQILLSTGVDQAVPANIDRTAEDIAAGIADQKRGVRDAGWFAC